MRVLVTGGRDYADTATVSLALDPYLQEYGKELIIIEGGAKGADRIAANWAYNAGLFYARVDAHWDRDGRGAGPRRNAAMLLLQPDIVVAFPGGMGTANMVAQAHGKGIALDDYR